ncbi:MAG: Phenylalanine-tRNA ligase beta subunit [Parcubacteria group bacterium GW2011_GWF2_38_8]|nr:MAG: Phenylalanine-tRNA ligase beta subunit [Parcubacteria group bacterium GW2011_GWF2_38_8]
MKISYNWLKWYIPNAPEPEKLRDIFTYHLCEVEFLQKLGTGENTDWTFDLNILPNRAHDLLSHQGIARELASLLDIKFIDPTLKYKIPDSKPTNLRIEIKSDKCRRYLGRIVKNVKIGPPPDWVKAHLESIGQRSINNIVDAANIAMYDCGQPIHCFDLDKVSGNIIIRDAEDGEQITTLDNKQVKLTPQNLVIADGKNVLAIAGVKGGKIAEVDENTKNIIIEIANFDPTSIRKTAQAVNITTDAKKRFENDLSPELCDFAMKEISGLMLEYGFTDFQEVVDVYPAKQIERKISFSAEKISKILGMAVSVKEIENILERYNFQYKESSGKFEITVPMMRLDLTVQEDIAEEIGRVIGYDKIKPKIPKIDFRPRVDKTFSKIIWARNKLLQSGYSEVMTYTFRDNGEVEVLASASDKKFLRTNLADGLRESLKLNQINAPLLLNINKIKIFEIGTVFLKDREEIHVAYNEKEKIVEISLDKFVSEKLSPEEYGYFSAEKFLVLAPSRSQGSSKETFHSQIFKPWSVFPFIARDIAVWVPEDVLSQEVQKIIKDNVGELIVKGPELFDKFKKDGKISYAFNLVFQSYERTLTDTEINKIMTKITNKIKKKNGWQVR